jgi:hypothetical protein
MLGFKIINNYYDHANWVVVLQKDWNLLILFLIKILWIPRALNLVPIYDIGVPVIGTLRKKRNFNIKCL